MTRGQRAAHRLVWRLLAPLLVATMVYAVVHRTDASSRSPEPLAAHGGHE